MNYWSILHFLKSVLPQNEFDHDAQMAAVQNYPEPNVIKTLKERAVLSSDYLNGMYFGLCLASASQEETFTQFVHNLMEKEELDQWQIKPPGKLQ